jgi:carboxymethylenebutenolidase
MGDIVEFPSNGHTASGYLAPNPDGQGAGVVLIQEYWGLVPHIKDVAERLAAEGFTVLAPDLYHGKTTSEPDEAGKLMMAMNIEQAGKDMSGAVDYLLGHDQVDEPKVGVIGFCMGGGLALVLGCQRPGAVGAVVPFYGLIPWEHAQPDYSMLDAPVLGHYAGEDGFFSPELVDELQSRLDALGKQADLEIYPGVDHAFFNDTRPEVYDAESAARAWVQTVGFLHSNLEE